MIIFPFVSTIGATTIPIESNSRVSFFMGYNSFQIERFNANNQIDFLNYLQYNNDIYIGLQTHLMIAPNTFVDIKTYLNSSFETDRLHLQLLYFPYQNIGFSAHYSSYPFYHASFTNYFSSSYHSFVPNKYEYFSVNNKRYLVGLALPFTSGKFSGLLQLRTGLSYLEENFIYLWQKKIDSNERRLIEYNLNPSFGWSFNPQLQCRWELVEFNKHSSMGLQLQVEWSYTSHSVAYNESIYTWTMNNLQQKLHKPQTHTLIGSDWNIGLYYGF